MVHSQKWSLLTLKRDLCGKNVKVQPLLNDFIKIEIYFYAHVCIISIARCSYSNSFTSSVTASTVSPFLQFLRHDSPSCSDLWPAPLKQHVKWCHKNGEGNPKWQPRFKVATSKSKHPVLWWCFDHEDHSVTLKRRVQLRPTNLLLQIQ